jgi:hypothetical protein
MPDRNVWILDNNMTKKQAFTYEYGRQRFIGAGVILAAWRALLAAFEPMPF